MHPATPPEAVRSDSRRIDSRLLQCQQGCLNELVDQDGLREIHVPGRLDHEPPPVEREVMRGNARGVEPVRPLTSVYGPGSHSRCPTVEMSRVRLKQGPAEALAYKAGVILGKG